MTGLPILYYLGQLTPYKSITWNAIKTSRIARSLRSKILNCKGISDTEKLATNQGVVGSNPAGRAT